MPNFVMDEKGVKQLATMQAPIGQFVRTLNEVPSRLVRTLAAIRDSKEAAPA
jgi:large subunit ribosomal protein L10